MDRRSFLVQSARMMGAVLTASFVTQVEAYVEHKNSPLLLPPSHQNRILYAIEDAGGKYCLYLDKHPLDDAIPEITWRDLIVDHWGWSEQDGIAHLQDNYGISKKEARAMLGDIAPEDSVGDWFYLAQSANAQAFFYLAHLDLGPDFSTNVDAAGEIWFKDGYCPGNDTRKVEVPENISLSLLQARLIDLGEDIKIEVATW